MRRLVAVVPIAAVALGVAVAHAGSPSPVSQGVPSANAKAGHPPNVVADGFGLRPVVQGSDQLENPDGVFDTFGFLNDGAPPNLEATKTEPDQNTYLVLKHPGRPDARLRLRPPLPVPGPRGRGRPRVRHAHQPRRKRSDPPHHAADAGRRHDDRLQRTRRLHLGPVRQRCCTRRRTAPSGGVVEQSPFWTSTSPPPAVQRSTAASARAASRASTPTPRQRPARRGRGRPDGADRPERSDQPKHGQAAELVRLPLRAGPPGRPDAGKLQVLQVTVDKHAADVDLHAGADVPDELPCLPRPRAALTCSRRPSSSCTRATRSR